MRYERPDQTDIPKNLERISCRTIAFMLLILCLYALFPCRSEAFIDANMLQGTWAGSNGQNTMTLLFNGNQCVMNMNGQQMQGVWNLQQNQLMISFQNGKTVRFSAELRNSTLILDGDIVLQKQGAPQGGVFPQQSPWPGQPQQASLDGTWSCSTPQGTMSFRFAGPNYMQLVNGMPVEQGIFQLFPDGRFQYQVTSGAYQGQTGENRLQMQGNAFTMFWPNGSSRTYVRDGTTSSVQGGGASDISALQGRWVAAASNRNMLIVLIIQGNMCVSYINGQESERSTIQMQNGRLMQTMLTGTAAGQTIMQDVQLSGNRMRLRIPGRVWTDWIRQ